MRSHTIGFVLLATSPTVAIAGPTCTGSSPTLPMSEVAKAFEAQGGRIKLMQETKEGCIKIYGYEYNKEESNAAEETKVEIYFDPRTGEVLQAHEG